MITFEQIQRLSRLRNRNYPIISLYLHLWPDRRIHHAKLKDLIKEEQEKLSENDLPKEVKKSVEEDLKGLQEFVGTIQESPYKGLVIFSSAAQNIWEVFLLKQAVPDLLVLDLFADIRPLVSILDEYRRVCVLLIDRAKARIFEIFMGEIEEQSEIFSGVPSKVREGGWYGLSEKRIKRHVEKHLHDYLKKAMDKAFVHFRQRGFDWLFLGGQSEILSIAGNTLHPYLKERLKTTFRMDLDASSQEVLNKILALEREVKKEEDCTLVSRLLNSLKPSGLGVSGIQETLSSLYERTVHTLLVEEGFTQKGAYCLDCGFMGLETGTCPFCRNTMVPVPDIVDEAVATAINQNSQVIHINAECALKEIGSIGALLRYAAGKGGEA
jgi:peptide subunit release factor 1 (eRF1)